MARRARATTEGDGWSLEEVVDPQEETYPGIDPDGRERLPLIAGRFAGADLSLEAYLRSQSTIMPGSDAAVAQMRAEEARKPELGATQRSPFGGDPSSPEMVDGIGVQRSPFV